MSTFSMLHTAYSGLTAARAGIDVVGQNIANVNTDGYTRQRVQTSPAAPLSEMGLGRVVPATKAGQGVTVDGVARLGDVFLETRARQTSSVAGYAGARAEAYSAVDSIHREPAEDAISSQLQSFWAAWQNLANAPGEGAQGHIVLQEAHTLVDRIAAERSQLADRWSSARFTAKTLTDEVNTYAKQVAVINHQIVAAGTQGRSVNELIDKRNLLTADLAKIAGASVQENADGTADVLLGGNFLVEGDRPNQVRLTGAASMDDPTAPAPRLEWAHRSGAVVDLGGGELAGHISALAPAGSGGVYAQAAAGYDRLAVGLATAVNGLYTQAATTGGTTGAQFFDLKVGVPAGAGLQVLPTDPQQVAAADPTKGALDGSLAEAVSQLGLVDGGPDDDWRAFVSATAVAGQSAAQDAALSVVAEQSAAEELASSSAVSLDEETVNLTQFQHAYTGAARVMTAVDEMLDHLINRTGRVGR